MAESSLHRWNLSITEAAELQRSLRGLVVEEDRLGPVRFVAGVDLSGVKSAGTVTAAAVLLTLPSLEPVEESLVRGVLEFPYLPGFLSFREAPLMMEAVRGLSRQPDLLVVDGQGRAHPRGLGIACHLGLLLDIPAIGCAKSRLVGRHDDPAPEAGSRTPLVYRGGTIGTVLRTKERVKPVFISVGHRVSLDTAVELALRCTHPGQRLPEPTRQAHLSAGRDSK